jgi:hypothetical protein
MLRLSIGVLLRIFELPACCDNQEVGLWIFKGGAQKNRRSKKIGGANAYL